MNFKSIIVLLAMSSTIFSLQAQSLAGGRPRLISIEGKIEGIESGKLYMLAQTGEQKVDTLGMANFQAPDFVLKGIVPEPMVVQIIVEGYQGGFTLLAEPNVTYEALLTNDSRSFIRGGKLQDAMTSYNRQADSLRTQLQLFRKRYELLRGEAKFRSASQTNDSLRRCERQLQQLTYDFLASHDDLITAHTYQSNALMKEANVVESKRLYDSMGPGAKATLSARLMKERIDRMEKTQGGAIAPDFTLSTPKGEKMTMSKIPGKIKIVDFWASWCGPCRLNNPALRKLYEQYHGKGLEIISISLDDNAKRWTDAIAKDKLDWINLSSLKGWKCEVARQYNITAIPAIFVLDESNHIIATNLRGETLNNFLQEKFK